MKLRNKKTDIIHKIAYLNLADKEDDIISFLSMKNGKRYNYNSLAELNEEWEDYEEGHRVYYLDYTGDVFDILSEIIHPEISLKMKRIGNYFETREEAERAVKNLKAWKRLKDKGFRFNGWVRDHKNGSANNTIATKYSTGNKEATRTIKRKGCWIMRISLIIGLLSIIIAISLKDVLKGGPNAH